MIHTTDIVSSGYFTLSLNSRIPYTNLQKEDNLKNRYIEKIYRNLRPPILFLLYLFSWLLSENHASIIGGSPLLSKDKQKHMAFCPARIGAVKSGLRGRVNWLSTYDWKNICGKILLTSVTKWTRPLSKLKFKFHFTWHPKILASIYCVLAHTDTCTYKWTVYNVWI